MSQITLRNFTGAAAQAGSEDHSIQLSGGALSEHGRVGTFFTRAATHRATISAFIGALRERYGDHIANPLAEQLADRLQEGRPLTAHAVRNLTRTAALAAGELTGKSEQDTLTVTQFINARDEQGQSALDKAIARYCAGHGITDETQKKLFTERVALNLLQSMEDGVFKDADLSLLGECISQGRFPAPPGTRLPMDQHLGVLQAIFQGPGCSDDERADRLQLAEFGLDRDLMLQTIEAQPRLRVIQPTGKLTAETVWRAVFNDAPPADVQNLAQAMTDRNTARTRAAVARQENIQPAVDRLLARDESADGLLAAVRVRSAALAPQARIRPEALKEIAARIRRQMNALSSSSLGASDDTIARPLLGLSANLRATGNVPTGDQLQIARDLLLGEYFTRLDALKAQVPDGERDLFVRACLENMALPPAALLPATTQLAGTMTHTLKNVLRANNAGDIVTTLSSLNSVMGTLWASHQGQGLELGGDDFALMQSVALRMGLLSVMGEQGPESVALGLARQGGPFRDLLYDLAHAPAEDENSGSLRVVVNLLRAELSAMVSIDTLTQLRPNLADTLTRLDGQDIQERDLSLARQRELFGPGVFQARGAGDAPATINDAPGAPGTLSRDWPAVTAHIRSVVEAGIAPKLRQPPDHAGWVPTDQFLTDYLRGGIYMDGCRLFGQLGGSGEDFVRLFPNRRAAALLSQIVHQQFLGIVPDAIVNCATDGVGLLAVSIGHPQMGNMAGSEHFQELCIDTLNREQGRYRISGLVIKQAGSYNPQGGPSLSAERMLHELSVEVTLGNQPDDQPTVDKITADFLLRGHEDEQG